MRATDHQTAAYLVDHHGGGTSTAVATGTRPLDMLAARLAFQGRGGYLAVGKDATGELVIRDLDPEEPAKPGPPEG